jgi:hypothetical protein
MLKQRPLVDYLLLEYLWRKRNYGLGVYVSENAITGDNFLYHGLELTDLTDRLYNLIQEGMFLLESDREYTGLNKVYLTKSELKKHLSFSLESEEYRLNNKIYMRLSFKGGKIWEQKVKANWNKYYCSLESPNHICIESKNKEFLSKVLEVYLANSILVSESKIDLELFRPWYPHFIYWKQFVKGYRYRFSVEKNNFDFKLAVSHQLRHWRWLWFYDKQKGLILHPPEELYS